MEQENFDVVIAGAGAAGLMCAIHCGEGRKALLLDTKPKPGAKILMSGGTRCNVTNRIVEKRDFHSEQSNIAGRVLSAYPSAKTIEFFSRLGVELVEEPGGKLFPSTHSGRTVLDALLKKVKAAGVRLEADRKVTQIEKKEGLFYVKGAHFEFRSRAVVLATGGLSYPSSGSDGTGYGLAASFGHSLVPTTPALTPLIAEDADWRGLSGLSLPARLTLTGDGKKEAVFEGPLLFTHFGFSGPAALNISRHWLRTKAAVKAITANFIYEQGEENFRAKIESARTKGAAKTLKNFLSESFPERFVTVLLAKAGIENGRTLSHLKKEERESMLALLLRLPLGVTGVSGYQKAEATAGGIPLTEIHSASMESKLIPGLFFAGEIMDVDGRIGGFNFQWAWASGYAAAAGVSAYLGRSG